MATQEEKLAQMDAAAAEAKKEFEAIMAKPKATALELVAFHQTHLSTCGHKRLGGMYRDFPLSGTK